MYFSEILGICVLNLHDEASILSTVYQSFFVIIYLTYSKGFPLIQEGENGAERSTGYNHDIVKYFLGSICVVFSCV